MKVGLLLRVHECLVRIHVRVNPGFKISVSYRGGAHSRSSDAAYLNYSSKTLSMPINEMVWSGALGIDMVTIFADTSIMW